MNVRYILARNSNNRSFFFAQQLDLFSSLMATFVTGKKEKKKKGKKNRAIRARIPTHTRAYVITNFRFNPGTSRFSTVGLSLLKSQHSATFFFFFFFFFFLFFFFFCNYHRPRTFHFFSPSLFIRFHPFISNLRTFLD